LEGRDRGSSSSVETLRVTLSGGTDAAFRARRAVDALNGGVGALREVTHLLVTELVTNSVRHAGAKEVDLELKASPKGVWAQVIDQGPGFRHPDHGKPTEDRGFGLFLVDRLSDRWGIEQGRPVKVWFEVDR
jgi:anti-sigma regulatory factor (Ser/Thr protein kinase)